MEEQKLVLKDSVVEINFETEQVIVPEEELRKAGYVKLADDEQVVNKVELSEEEAKFMKENRHLPFLRQEDRDFARASFRYCESREVGEEVYHKGNRLVQAYFNGYTVKKEPRYYIKLPEWLAHNTNEIYLNVYKTNGYWVLDDRFQVGYAQTQFVQSKIDELQKDERAKGLDLTALKVRVPNNELTD
ncbi:MAG: DUF1642 domain-containing protein [Ligilactobacillus animalis]|uniref:DUF1642 domain-containing protein n=1 Tax=Ligilactobacillus animalis TaxID=1605 RepID=UPI00242FAF9F|nr:DUF1642 domain-containing protein [Ligilactobacillus animalis]MCI5942929.1 DUF1642 domain-containing protein [Ligilactobacillus animalis]MDY2993763.1 DUF1642 domain-containing protein [Ligilactobacillus animalis]